MMWTIKDKETIIKTKFAVLPKRIGNYRIWLQRYYETYDYMYSHVYSCYVPHWFINKEDAVIYVNSKLDPSLQY